MDSCLNSILIKLLELKGDKLIMNKPTEEKQTQNNPLVTSRLSDKSEMILGKVPQGYDTNINIRFVPARDIRLEADVLGCQPRQGAQRRDAQPVTLPLDLVDKLRDASKRVMEWMARDAANANLFLTQPVQAMLTAGIELTRAEQKMLERTYAGVKSASVIAPGVKVVDLSATAHPKGKVGGLKTGPTMKDKHKQNNNC